MLPDLGLLGLAQSGKDTVARILVDDYGYRRVAFADALKAVALATDPIVIEGAADKATLRLSRMVDAFGWEGAKAYPEVRRFLQHLGVAVRTHAGPGVWIDAALDNADTAHAIGVPCVFTDVRFLNEVHAIRSTLGGFLLRVRRTRSESFLDGSLAAHVSETELVDYHAAYTIENNGSLEDLTNAVHETMARITILESSS